MITATNNPLPSSPDASPTKLDKGGYEGTAETLDNKIDEVLAEALLKIEGVLSDSTIINNVTTSSAVPATGNIHAIGIGPGTYTNWGGMVVPANNTGTLSRVDGVYSVSLTAFADVNKILPWVAQVYPINAQVNYLGKDWVSNAATVAGDIPGTSTKWNVRLTAYENKADLVVGKNLFNKATATNGYYVNNINAEIYNVTFSHSNFIPVTVGTQYKANGSGVRFTCYYDENKAFVSGGSSSTISTFTVPIGVSFVIVSYWTAENDTFQLEKGSVVTFYEPYQPTLLLTQTKKIGYPFDRNATFLTEYSNVFDYLQLSGNIDINERYYISNCGKGNLGDAVNKRKIYIKNSSNNFIIQWSEVSTDTTDLNLYKVVDFSLDGVNIKAGFYPNRLGASIVNTITETLIDVNCINDKDYTISDEKRLFPFTDDSEQNLREVIKEIEIYGAEYNHDYYFSLAYINYDGSGGKGIQFHLSDVATGLVVARGYVYNGATPYSGYKEFWINGLNDSTSISAKITLDIPYGDSFTTTVENHIQKKCIKTEKWKLLTPLKYPVVVSKTAYIYFENIIKNEYENNLFLTANQYFPNNKYVKIIPDNLASSKLMRLDAKQDGILKSRNELTVIHVPIAAGTGITNKVCVIGDSKTDNPTKLIELLNLFSTDVMSIELIGTQDVATAKNEGYSGTTVIDFVDGGLLNGLTNPFLNTGVFDFSYYISNNGFTGCDILFIDMGANQITSNYTDIKDAYDEIIASAKAYNPDIKIVISIQEGACLLEQTDNSVRQNKAHINSHLEQMLIDFDDREFENIFICPQYLNVDLYFDFPIVQDAVNSRNPLLVNKCSDTVHPAIPGYLKIADIYFNVIKYLATV